MKSKNWIKLLMASQIFLAWESGPITIKQCYKSSLTDAHVELVDGRVVTTSDGFLFCIDPGPVRFARFNTGLSMCMGGKCAKVIKIAEPPK